MKEQTNKSISITWAEKKWILDHRRVLIQEEEELLILSDIHIGLYSSLRTQGSYLPNYDQNLLMDQLSSLIKDYKNFHWIIAGDIKHNHAKLPDIQDDELEELTLFLQLILQNRQVTFILGDHDSGFEEICEYLGLQCIVQDSFKLGDIEITHKLENYNNKNLQLIIGHIHPTISTEQIKGIFIPIFAINNNIIILPAFNQVAGGYNIKKINYLKNLEIFPIIKDKIYSFGLLKDIDQF